MVYYLAPVVWLVGFCFVVQSLKLSLKEQTQSRLKQNWRIVLFVVILNEIISSLLVTSYLSTTQGLSIYVANGILTVVWTLFWINIPLKCMLLHGFIMENGNLLVQIKTQNDDKLAPKWYRNFWMAIFGAIIILQIICLFYVSLKFLYIYYNMIICLSIVCCVVLIINLFILRQFLKHTLLQGTRPRSSSNLTETSKHKLKNGQKKDDILIVILLFGLILSIYMETMLCINYSSIIDGIMIVKPNELQSHERRVHSWIDMNPPSISNNGLYLMQNVWICGILIYWLHIPPNIDWNHWIEKLYCCSFAMRNCKNLLNHHITPQLSLAMFVGGNENKNDESNGKRKNVDASMCQASNICMNGIATATATTTRTQSTSIDDAHCLHKSLDFDENMIEEMIDDIVVHVDTVNTVHTVDDNKEEISEMKHMQPQLMSQLQVQSISPQSIQIAGKKVIENGDRFGENLNVMTPWDSTPKTPQLSPINSIQLNCDSPQQYEASIQIKDNHRSVDTFLKEEQNSDATSSLRLIHYVRDLDQLTFDGRMKGKRDQACVEKVDIKSFKRESIVNDEPRVLHLEGLITSPLDEPIRIAGLNHFLGSYSNLTHSDSARGLTLRSCLSSDLDSIGTIGSNHESMTPQISVIIYEMDNVMLTNPNRYHNIYDMKQFNLLKLTDSAIELSFGGKERINLLRHHLSNLNLINNPRKNVVAFVSAQNEPTPIAFELLKKTGLHRYFVSQKAKAKSNECAKFITHVIGKNHPLRNDLAKEYILILKLLQYLKIEHDKMLYIGHNKEMIDHLVRINACHTYHVGTKGMTFDDFQNIELMYKFG